jgi:hypothetical protein
MIFAGVAFCGLSALALVQRHLYGHDFFGEHRILECGLTSVQEWTTSVVYNDDPPTAMMLCAGAVIVASLVAAVRLERRARETAQQNEIEERSAILSAMPRFSIEKEHFPFASDCQANSDRLGEGPS